MEERKSGNNKKSEGAKRKAGTMKVVVVKDEDRAELVKRVQVM